MTETEFLDYIRCPLHYQTIHERKLPFANEPSFNQRLSRIANVFCLNLMNGSILHPYELKKKWDKACEEGHLTPQQCMRGIGLLNQTFRWAEDKQLRIADVNTPYKMVLNGRHGKIEFRGETGIVSMNSQGGYELLVLDFGNRLPDQSILDLKLTYTLDCFAFKKLYSKELGVHLHHVKDNKDYYSYRNKHDFERLIETVDAVDWNIRNKVYFPRESVFCSNCNMKEICRAWPQK